jgi:hypothetical protein
MKTFRPILKVVPVVALFLALPGNAATAGAISADKLGANLQSLSPSLVEPAHCRRYWHTHRVCVRWSRGVCRSWRVRRHRC